MDGGTEKKYPASFTWRDAPQPSVVRSNGRRGTAASVLGTAIEGMQQNACCPHLTRQGYSVVAR